MNYRAAPGSVRDAIVNYLTAAECASIAEIQQAVAATLGDISASSVRSYLNLNTPELFERTSRGQYCLRPIGGQNTTIAAEATYSLDRAKLVHVNCFDWLRACAPRSVHAIVTDPPYGLVEYSETEQSKLRKGRGGVWRIPPSFDGHQRAPLPRFTVLNESDRRELHCFFARLGILLARVTVPGANIVVASNPLLSHIVASAMSEN